jgi:hypothetical protein
MTITYQARILKALITVSGNMPSPKGQMSTGRAAQNNMPHKAEIFQLGGNSHFQINKLNKASNITTTVGLSKAKRHPQTKPAILIIFTVSGIREQMKLTAITMVSGQQHLTRPPTPPAQVTGTATIDVNTVLNTHMRPKIVVPGAMPNVMDARPMATKSSSAMTLVTADRTLAR